MFSTFVTSYHLLVEKLFSPHFYEFPVCILNTQNVSSCFYKYDAIVGVFYLMVAFAIYSLVWSIIGNNCSKVDQIWSVTPFVYSWVFYVHYHQGKSLFETSHPRLLLLSALMTMWGVRLTYNFWRRGGYGNLITHEEDYRWPIVRRIINNSFLFLIFNITFIAGYQNLLLFLIAMPAYAVMADKQVQIGTQDIILTAVFLLLLAMETIADQQHFNFHTRKHAVKETKSVAAKSADIDIKEGFLQSGLFKYSRHPNYFAEQALWVVVYLFSVPMTSTTTLDTSLTVYAFGSILLVLLFQGSMSLVGTSPERAVDAARKMEQENRSFTSKMMQKIGEFVNGNRKTSAAQGSDTAEKGSVTTDSTSGEEYFHESEFATPAKTRSFGGSVMALFRSAKSPHSSSFSTRRQSSFSIHRSSEKDVTAIKPKDISAHFSDPLEPSLLYHFPLTGPEPPTELCDFCMPGGCRLRQIEDDVTLSEVFYGQKQSTRNGRSFTFLLENRTVPKPQVHCAEGVLPPEGGQSVEESGSDSGRLYGFCVIHSRYLNVSGYSAAVGEAAAPASYDFESPVCYAFISKYPFHEFFFNVIYDIINTERVLRMDMIDTNELLPYESDIKNGAAKSNNTTREIDRHTYVYLQRSLLEEILGKVQALSIPKFGETLKFNVSTYLSQTLSFTRPILPPLMGEHMLSSSQWALPVLLSWMPYEALVWAIGLIVCEAKMIVVGSEVGMVSCAISGLLSLIQPLKWVAPLIPILPLKHFEFVESPVPLLAGLVIDAHAALTVKPSSILQLCNDEENGTLTAVFDVSEREIFVAVSNASLVHDVLMPGTEGLLMQLKAGPKDQVGSSNPSSLVPTRPLSTARSGTMPKLRSLFSSSQETQATTMLQSQLHAQEQAQAYLASSCESAFSVTTAKADHAKFVQQCMHKHISAVVEMAQAQIQARSMQKVMEQQERLRTQLIDEIAPTDPIVGIPSMEILTAPDGTNDEDIFTQSRRVVSFASDSEKSYSPTKLGALLGVNALTSSSGGSSMKQGATGKSISVQTKSLRWSEIGGIIIGDGVGSSTASSYWVTAQLTGSDRNLSRSSRAPSPVKQQTTQEETAVESVSLEAPSPVKQQTIQEEEATESVSAEAPSPVKQPVTQEEEAAVESLEAPLPTKQPVIQEEAVTESVSLEAPSPTKQPVIQEEAVAESVSLEAPSPTKQPVIQEEAAVELDMNIKNDTKEDGSQDSGDDSGSDDSIDAEDLELVSEMVHNTLSLDTTVRNRFSDTNNRGRDSEDSYEFAVGRFADLSVETNAVVNNSSSVQPCVIDSSNDTRVDEKQVGHNAADSQRSSSHIPDDILAALTNSAPESFQVVGLSLESLDSDVHAFIQRFTETQLYSEYSSSEI